jgi:hypothetical protein
MTADWERIPWLYFDDFGEAHRTHALYGVVKQADDGGRPLVDGRAPQIDPYEHAYGGLLGERGIKVRTVTVVSLENGRRLQARACLQTYNQIRMDASSRSAR